MQKRKAVIALIALALVLAAAAGAQESAAPAANAAVAAQAQGGVQWKYLAAAIAVGVACVAGGPRGGADRRPPPWAPWPRIPSSPERALPYVGLAEGICLWGFLVALLMLLI